MYRIFALVAVVAALSLPLGAPKSAALCLTVVKDGVDDVLRSALFLSLLGGLRTALRLLNGGGQSRAMWPTFKQL